MTTFPLTTNAVQHRFKLHQLQIFERVMERRSLSRAANELNLTQPSVSKAIGELERGLGVVLFERSNRGVEPTEIALQLNLRVKAILAEIRHITDEINASLVGETGHLVIGTLMAGSAELVPQAVTALLQHYPGIQIRIQEGPSSDLFPALATGDLDIVVGRLPDQPALPRATQTLSHHTLYQERLSVVTGTTHPATQTPALKLADLMDELWILPTPATTLREEVEQTFLRQGLPLPSRHIESLSILSNLGILCRGQAIGLMPSDAAGRFLHPGLLAELPIDVFQRFGEVGYSLCEQRKPSASTRLFIEQLELATQRRAG